jgi:hypothetical protein
MNRSSIIHYLNGKGEAHSIQVWGGRFNEGREIPIHVQWTFWSLVWVYYHHPKIMLYDVIKKMT